MFWLFTTQSRLFTTFEGDSFCKHFGKGENASNLLFLKMFSTLPIIDFNFWVTFILSSACALNLDESKILSFGKDVL